MVASPKAERWRHPAKKRRRTLTSCALRSHGTAQGELRTAQSKAMAVAYSIIPSIREILDGSTLKPGLFWGCLLGRPIWVCVWEPLGLGLGAFGVGFGGLDLFSALFRLIVSILPLRPPQGYVALYPYRQSNLIKALCGDR